MLGKEAAQPSGPEHQLPLKHRLLLTKSFGILPDGGQTCEGLLVLWDKALPVARVPGAQPLLRDRTAQLSTPAHWGDWSREVN